MSSRHVNSGDCPRCNEIMDRYPGFYPLLRSWFKAFQSRHPEAHTSCAGRGELDQEAAVINRTSHAHWGESAHNYNAAIDFFEMRDGAINIYERDWFTTVLEPELEPWLTWYGKPGSPYYELPHVESTYWRMLVANGVLRLVGTFPVA